MSESDKKIDAASDDGVSVDVRNKAEKLLKSEALHFIRCDGSTLSALFKESKNDVLIRTEVSMSADVGESKCSCLSAVSLCEHAVAALEHYRLHRGRKTKRDGAKAKSNLTFKGLASTSASQLSVKSASTARLEIYFSALPPHAPSKWEKLTFKVAISAKNRQYIGNPANLRQLSFGKGLGAALDIQQFPSRDRQIIRFLALNAEHDARDVALSADSAAEFMHCLIGSDNCFFASDAPTITRGKLSGSQQPFDPICFHAIPAEFVINVSGGGSTGVRAMSSLSTEIGVIPLRTFALVCGQGGCWVGVDRDYWWIPGNRDLTRLRSLILAKPERLNGDELEKLLLSAKGEGVVVTRGAASNSPRVAECVPFYDVNESDSADFELSLRFNYNETTVGAGDNNLHNHGKSIWKRDSATEKARVSELLALGFVKRGVGVGCRYILRSPESVGLFFDEVVPRWIAEKRKMAMSAEFAGLLGVGGGLGEIRMVIETIDETIDPVSIEPVFVNGSVVTNVTWKDLLASVKKNRIYVSCGTAAPIARIGRSLADFVRATMDFTRQAGRDSRGLFIPRAALPYWGEVFERFIGEMPYAARKLLDNLSEEARETSDEMEKCEARVLFEGELRPYQSDGVEWLKGMFGNKLNAILADEMGLGKTIQTLALFCDAKLADGDNLRPSMILCPSSLVDNWRLEAAKFAPSLSTLVLRGPKRKALFECVPKTDIVIASYATAGRDVDILKKIEFKFLVLDEAQHIKNPSTLNASTAKSLNAESKLVLTGTPMENAPVEFWSIFDFLHPGLLGSLNAFKNRYGGIVSNEEMQLDLAARTAPFILRRKKCDVEPDLPEKHMQTLFCEMPAAQRELYVKCRDEGLEHLRKLMRKGGKSRFDLLTNLLRLRQICCHPALIPGMSDYDPNAPSAKTELLKELLLESIDSGHKVLVFSQFTSFLSILRDWLGEENIPYEYLDGSTTKRQEKVDAFNVNPDVPLFLLSLRAGGLGLNLTSADRVIIYDPWWNPAVEAQATDRTHRIGQTKKVHAMKLVVKDSIEEKILKLQEQKQRVFQNLVESPSAAMKNLSDEDLEFLLV